jgi:hypothetical protein
MSKKSPKKSHETLPLNGSILFRCVIFLHIKNYRSVAAGEPAMLGGEICQLDMGKSVY